MAENENKQGFIMYHSFRSMFSETTPEQCQKLIVALFDFAMTGVVTDFTGDPILKICFDQMSYLVGRNQERYEKKCERNKKIAQDGWEKRKLREKVLKEIIEDRQREGQDRLNALKEYEELYGDVPFK